MQKIFFAASTYAAPQLLSHYLLVIQAIKRAGARVIIDWPKEWRKITEYYQKQGKYHIKEKDVLKIIDRKKLLNEHIKAIHEADAIIAEVTKPTISVGYQLFHATSHNKPILALYLDNLADMNEVNTIINTKANQLILKKYTDNSLTYIISCFLKKSKSLQKFNFIISTEIKDYLDWIQKQNPQQSKSELLREKIINEVIARDNNYETYFSHITS